MTMAGKTGDDLSAGNSSVGAGLWWALSGIVAAFIGGYVASRLSGRPKASTGGWHGLISWALTTLVVVYLLTTAVGGLIGGAFNTVTGAVGGVDHAVGTAAQTAVPALSQGTDPAGALQQALSAPTDGQADIKAATASFAKALATGDDAQVADAREKVAQALSRSQNIPVDQARARVASTETQFREHAAQAKQGAAEAADAAAKGVSRGALLGSLALVLGAIASWFGGRAGTVDPTVTAQFIRSVRVRENNRA